MLAFALRCPAPKLLFPVLALLGGSIAADLSRAQVPGQIIVAPENPAGLIREDGSPFFLCGPGDPEDFLFRGNEQADGTRDGDQDELIAKLAASGANAIYVQAVRSHGGDGDSSHNPFVDHNPANGLDDDILAQWNGWFEALDDAGVVTFFIFYDDDAEVWATGDTVEADEAAFFTGLVDAFEHHANLIWCVAEEYSEELTPARVSSLAQIIRAADDHDHPLAVHQLSGVTFDFPDDPIIDLFAMQTTANDAETEHDLLVGAREDADDRYGIIMAEMAGHGDLTGASLRELNWAVAMAGSHVMVYLMDIASTPEADLAACGYMVDFFERVRIHELTPSDELAYGDSRWVLAEADTQYIAYTNTLSDVMGVRDLPAGRIRLTWLNPATGYTVEEPEQMIPGGDGAFSPPPDIGPEAALLIEVIDRGTPVQGSTWGLLKGQFRLGGE